MSAAIIFQPPSTPTANSKLTCIYISISNCRINSGSNLSIITSIILIVCLHIIFSPNSQMHCCVPSYLFIICVIIPICVLSYRLFSVFQCNEPASPYCIEGGGGNCVLMYTNKCSNMKRIIIEFKKKLKEYFLKCLNDTPICNRLLCPNCHLRNSNNAVVNTDRNNLFN